MGYEKLMSIDSNKTKLLLLFITIINIPHLRYKIF